MKMIHIPSSCPKCENQVFVERLEDMSVVAYCRQCDFILPIDKNEYRMLFESTEEIQ